MRFAELGTSLDRARYGEISAVLAVRLEPKDLREVAERAGEVAEAILSEPAAGRSATEDASLARGLKISGEGDWKDVRGCKD